MHAQEGWGVSAAPPGDRPQGRKAVGHLPTLEARHPQEPGTRATEPGAHGHPDPGTEVPPAGQVLDQAPCPSAECPRTKDLLAPGVQRGEPRL